MHCTGLRKEMALSCEKVSARLQRQPQPAMPGWFLAKQSLFSAQVCTYQLYCTTLLVHLHPWPDFSASISRDVDRSEKQSRHYNYIFFYSLLNFRICIANSRKWLHTATIKIFDGNSYGICSNKSATTASTRTFVVDAPRFNPSAKDSF